MVEGIYMGQQGQSYLVNVRTKNPTGKLGDAGYIRRFDSKEEAKIFAEQVNETGVDTFEKQPVTNDDQETRHAGDEFISLNNNQKYTTPPEISWGRAVTGFLTQEQVDAINETRRLPDNVKIIPNGFGGYTLTYNYFGLRAGTQTVPEGFEFKQDVIGVAHIVPKDTNGVIYK